MTLLKIQILHIILKLSTLLHLFIICGNAKMGKVEDEKYQLGTVM